MKRLICSMCVALVVLFAAIACTTSPAAKTGITAQSEKNRQAAVAFMKNIDSGNVPGAFDKYVGATLKQHGPRIPDGREAALAFYSNSVKNRAPGTHWVVRQSFADGDRVALFSELMIGSDKPHSIATLDIFRFDDHGKVVEHWGIAQPVPETAENSNGMF